MLLILPEYWKESVELAVVNEGISVNGSGLNFGNYLVTDKIKVKDFDVEGDIFSVKTHNAVTRLEKNGKLLIESVPGASFFGFNESEKGVTFSAYGNGDTQITLELQPGTEYGLFTDGTAYGKMKSTLSGKISFSVELNNEKTDIEVKLL